MSAPQTTKRISKNAVVQVKREKRISFGVEKNSGGYHKECVVWGKAGVGDRDLMTDPSGLPGFWGIQSLT